MKRHSKVRHRTHVAINAISAALFVISMTAEARAHFLFIGIGTHAEAGRSAEVYFSDQAEAGDPKFVGKIAHTKLWAQVKPGEFRELAVRPGADRLRALLPSEKSVVVVGECQYGVLARPNETAFLLRYFPKAMAGTFDELNRMTPKREIPFEIVAIFEGGGNDKLSDAASHGLIRISALRHGSPIPNASFTAVDSKLTESNFTAGPDGRAKWTPPAAGRYSIYVRETLKQTGTLDGKAYEEIREFATLALTWPLENHETDTEANALFAEALRHRAAWRDLPGFSAEITGWLDGRPFTGKVTVDADSKVAIEADDPASKSWLQDQLDSMVMHRQAPPPADSSRSKGMQFRLVDEPNSHPLGKLIAVEGGQMASSYRIKDHQIFVVNRRMGHRNMTITILENGRNPEGDFLPHSYVVQYWDADTGKLKSTETIQENWQRVGSWDLPTSHSVMTASDDGLSLRSVHFRELKLLGKK